MKLKLVESFDEVRKEYKPHTKRLLALIGSDLLNECSDPIILKEDINDGTVRKDSKIISLIDNSHLECLIENPIPGTTSFVGQYIDGESAGTKYTFVYCDDAGSNFAESRFNTTCDQLPTEIFEVDGEDKGSYMIFTDEEIRALDNPSPSITEDIKSNEYIECLVVWKQENTYYAHSTSASDYKASSLKALLEEVKEGLESESFDFDELVKIENKVTDTQEEFGTCGVILAYYKDLEKSLTEGNSLTNCLPPSIDEFLMDLAQIQGTFTYLDVYNFAKKGVTKEQIAKLRSLRRKYINEMQYDEESDKIKAIADQAATIIKSEPITEAVDKVDVYLSDKDIIDMDDKTGDIIISDETLKFTPNLSVIIKFEEDEDNTVHKFIMKSHDDTEGIITLAYDTVETLTEELLMEGPFDKIKKAVSNRKADKETKKALEMDKNPEAKNWTYIVDGKSMGFSEYKELDDAKRANAIVLDKGFYIRRGTEDLSDRLIRYTKDNADTTGHEYSSKADRKAAAQKIKDDEKGSGINLRNYQYAELNSDGSVKEDGKILSYADFIELDDAEKSKYQGVNKKGEILTYEELAPAIDEYNKKAAKKAETDAQTMIQDAEDENAKKAAETGKATYSKIQNTTTRKNAQGKAIKPKGKLTFISIEKDKDGKPVSTIDATKYAKLDKKTKQEYIARDSKGQEFDYKALLNLSKQSKKLKMESLDEEFGDILDDAMLLEELFIDDEEILEESVSTIPGDEIMAGWIDNMSQEDIDSELKNINLISKKLGLDRPEDLALLVDDDMYYDPANYNYAPAERGKDNLRIYDIEGIKFAIQPNANGGYYLYFSSDDAANRYANIIDVESQW